jgi:twitching motility two-component system response regulator PilH
MTNPTVYFIDDSATMREVIKIAFRRENINVVACHDGASALAEMERNRPNVVISDVIMPDTDGYEVCQRIKAHAQLSKTPVILMSGVVNRTVAERAFAVKADELIRKPFQPQDLITRVKHLLNPAQAVPVSSPVAAAVASASAALSSIFSQATPAPQFNAAMVPARVASAGAARTTPGIAAPLPESVMPVTTLPARPIPVPAPRNNGAIEVQKARIELMRMQQLVKKLQSELEAEREYSRALEAHVKTLQESE